MAVGARYYTFTVWDGERITFTPTGLRAGTTHYHTGDELSSISEIAWQHMLAPVEFAGTGFPATVTGYDITTNDGPDLGHIVDNTLGTPFSFTTLEFELAPGSGYSSPFGSMVLIVTGLIK